MSFKKRVADTLGKAKLATVVAAATTKAKAGQVYNRVTGKRDPLEDELEQLLQGVTQDTDGVSKPTVDLTDAELLSAAQGALKRRLRAQTRETLRGVHGTLDRNFETIFRSTGPYTKRSEFLDAHAARIEEACARLVVRIEEMESKIPKQTCREQDRRDPLRDTTEPAPTETTTVEPAASRGGPREESDSAGPGPLVSQPSRTDSAKNGPKHTAASASATKGKPRTKIRRRDVAEGGATGDSIKDSAAATPSSTKETNKSPKIHNPT